MHHYAQQTLVRTPVVIDFERVLANCWHDGRMGVVVARNGRGKTSTVRSWAKRNPRANAAIVQCPSVCTRRDLVRLLCQALSIDTTSSPQPAWEQLVFETVKARHMLIVDEAGYLVADDRRRKTSPLRLLQDLHDLCGCPVVLIMRPDQWSRLESGRFANDDEQLLGRILHRSIQIKLAYKKEEIETIIRMYYKGEITKKLHLAVKTLLDREVGGIRALTHDLGLAKEFTQAKGGEFDEAFISATERRFTAPHLDKLENF